MESQTIGSDFTIEIALKDNADAALDISTAQGEAVYLFQSKSKLIARYSKNALSGFITGVTISDEANGKLSVDVSREISAKMEQGILSATVEVQFPNEGDRTNTETAAVDICTMVKGFTKRIDIS